MLRCKDIVDLLEAYLEHGLDPATTQALTAHLADCPDCTAFLNTYRRTVGTTRELREEELPARPSLAPSATGREQMRELLAED